MSMTGLYRLYVGNLASEVTENTLSDLWQQNSLDAPLRILVKRGYAFIDCCDQNSFDLAFERLDGTLLMGSVLQVEPSLISRRRRSNRLIIRNIPSNCSREQVENLVQQYGQVQRCDVVLTNGDLNIHVQYDTPEQAQGALEILNNMDYQGATLKVDFASSKDNGNNGRPNRFSGNNRNVGFPLRILVPGDYVGAIIGKKGATIREITTTCKARVDVQQKGATGFMDKIISIFGAPDKCTIACKQILEVMSKEAVTNNRGEVILRMLIEDRFCGRLIGKEGRIIKKIREDTQTKITVSNVHEMPTIYPDRVISVRGPVENMSLAEAEISTKLRECYEKEAAGMMATMAPGAPQRPPMYPMQMGMGGSYVPPPGPYGYQGGPYMPPGNPMMGGMPTRGGGSHETIYVFVPSAAVGALIGTGGAHIKQLIRESGAFITIEGKRPLPGAPVTEEDRADRMVTVRGSPEARWKASFLLFDKLKREGFTGGEEPRLCTTVRVPRGMVGRVIGKAGKNVRELQRLSGAMIKIPEDQAQQGEEVSVDIYGNVMQTNMAQNRLLELVHHSNYPTLTPPLSAPPNGTSARVGPVPPQ